MWVANNSADQSLHDQVRIWCCMFPAEPPGWPLQATRSGDLLPGEPKTQPVGAWTGPAGTLKGLASKPGNSFCLQILMNWRIRYPRGDWDGAVLTEHKQELMTRSDWRLWVCDLLCAKDTDRQKSRFSLRMHWFAMAAKQYNGLLSRSSACAYIVISTMFTGCDINHRRSNSFETKLPHPNLLLLECLCLSMDGEECCSGETMPGIPVYSNMGEVQGEKVCVCVCENVWYACKMLKSFFST